MYKVNVSKRYAGLFKVSLVKNDEFGSELLGCCCFDTPCLFRTDSSARQVGAMLLGDMALGNCNTNIFIGNEAVLLCSESTAQIVCAIWQRENLFLGEVSVGKPANRLEYSVLERVYRGML